jgi:eukaryotic-like serine/threonine-protein kinase
MRTVRLFVSSPQDVAIERDRAKYVVEGLNRQFSTIVKFETILWEDQHYSAHISTQRQILEAADCDIVLTVFWKLLGTPLPAEFSHMPNGAPWPSGTAYETLTAIEARNRPGATLPDIYIFEKRQKRTFEEHELGNAQQQLNSLRDFLNELRRKNGGGIKTFEDTDDFATQVDQLLRQWIEKNVTYGQKIVIWPSQKESPFRGLAVFDRKHADVFFGRSRRTMRAIDDLRAAARERLPFLLIIGPSGSGKSSLMRAGLTPLLTAPGVVPEVNRWRTAVVNAGWAEKPFEALANALLVAGEENDDPGGFGPALPELRGAYRLPELLARMLAGAAEADEAKASNWAATIAKMLVDSLDEAALGERERAGFGPGALVRMDLLLLVDQLEELFTAAEGQQAGVVRLLQALVGTKRIWVVATLRADFFDKMILYRPLFALKDKGAEYDLGPPGEAELTEIVQRSAEAAGLTYGIDGKTGQSLDELILNDAVGGDSLPLLEFTLNELYAAREIIDGKIHLTVEAYVKMGRLDGAINSAAERAINNLPESDRAALPQLLTSLVVSVRDKDEVTAGEHWRTARLVPSEEAAPDDHARALVKALLDNRILLAFNQIRAPQVDPEVAQNATHGSLAADRLEANGRAAGIDSQSAAPGSPPIAALRIAHERVLRNWKLAKQIIDSHQDFIRMRDDVEALRRKWVTNNYVTDDLITSSAALNDAEQNLARFGPLFSPEVHIYIKASLRHASMTRWIKRAAVILLAVFAGLAGAASVYAFRNAVYAHDSYRTALDIIGKFTGSVLTDLRERGVSIGVVGQVLQTAEQGVDRLEQQRGDDSDLNMTHGTLLFEFGKTYQFAQDGKHAWENAKKSVQLRERVIVVEPNNAELQWQLSESLELYGDLLRSEKHDLAAARATYIKVLSIRDKFPVKSAEKKAIGLSQIYVRLGDLYVEQKQFKEARARYGAAFDVIRIAMLQERGNRPLERELSWDYNKLSDVPESTARRAGTEQALQYLGDALCIRRHLAYHNDANALLSDPENTELRDVTWTLDRMAAKKLDLNDRAGAESLYEASLGLRRYLSDKDVSNVLYLSDLSLSEGNMSKLYAGDVAEAHLTTRPTRDDDLARAVEKLDGKAKNGSDVTELKMALVFAQASLGHRRGLLAGAIPPGDAPPCTPGASQPQSVSKQNWNGYCQFQPIFEELCQSQGMSKPACVRDTSWQPKVSDLERQAYERWDNTVPANDTCLNDIMRELAANKSSDQAANVLP